MVGMYRAVSTGEVYEIYLQKKELMMRYVHNGRGEVLKPQQGWALGERWNKFNVFVKI